MIKKTLTILSFLLIISPAFNQNLNYYLPGEISYDPDIPTPAEVIGHEVGEWHITHDKLVYYMRALDEASDRIIIEEIGTTHEGRLQLLLIITSPENHDDLDRIKNEHIALTDPSRSGSMDISEMPAVVLQGYSIHGNEASGSNAALLTAYHYAAAQGEAMEQLLSDLVILLDPSFNPDGLTRFSTWANSRKSKNLISDENNQEQNEYWPGGRTNHYWFDLNRDWLPVQQPESKNRIAKFHEWKPNVLTDHHEMGTNSTFFFQPGIPSRNNPNTPQNNYVITEKIGEFHARALDDIGSLYYSKENYDDFYYGKGSTFPDINGGIGILFEQASSRGHLQESIHGELSFPFTIRNQFVTSLSTVEAAAALRTDLLDHQRKFFRDAMKMAANSNNKGIIFGSSNDASRSRELASILNQHKVEVYALENDANVNGENYKKATSYFVPLDQPQYRIIDIMFETVLDFQDSLFYDVSTWTLPMAFNLNYDYLDSREVSSVSRGERFTEGRPVSTDFPQSSYAYAFEWGDYFAPAMLGRLLEQGIICKVSEKSFSNGSKNFGRGTILIPLQIQSMDKEKVYTAVKEASNEYGIEVTGFNSGNTTGIQLGSPSFNNIRKPKIAMLVEGGVRSYDAGEIWHLLDNRLDIELSLIPIRIFNRMKLDEYNTLILAHGWYNDVSTTAVNRLKEWIKDGGTVISVKGANRWLKNQEILKVDYVAGNNSTEDRRDYKDLRKFRGAQATGGSIFTGDLDLSNPIGYGYESREIPVFVNTNRFISPPENPYAKPLVFGNNPLKSGYISEENYERIKNSAGIVTSGYGRGTIISFAFNPNFRAFWYGTNKLFLNAIFFGETISGSSTQ